MPAINSVVAVYKTQADARDGMTRLETAAFDLKTVSLAGRELDFGANVVGYYQISGRMKYCGARSAFWDKLWSVLPGAAYFVVPGIGGMLLAGHLTSWFVTALDHPVEGLTAIGASLFHVGIPQANAYRYDCAIRMHKLLLLAHGTSSELLNARDILHESRPEEIDIHFGDAGARFAA